LLTAREIALAAGCSPRTARRAIRRALGSGLTTFGAERWPEPLVREALVRNILRRNGQKPAETRNKPTKTRKQSPKKS
jgi:hypothetical protein